LDLISFNANTMLTCRRHQSSKGEKTIEACQLHLSYEFTRQPAGQLKQQVSEPRNHKSQLIEPPLSLSAKSKAGQKMLN
jgi:hypothetical protein